MESGKLRHQLKIQKATKKENQHGELIENWEDHIAVYGRIKPTKSKEKVEFNGYKNIASYTITIRYLPHLKTSDRIIFNNRLFNIDSVINVEEKNKTMLVECFEEEN